MPNSHDGGGELSRDEEFCDAVRTILRGFDEGVFVRDISGDHNPGWAIKLMPFVRAIGVAQTKLSGPARAAQSPAELMRAHLATFGATEEGQ